MRHYRLSYAVLLFWLLLACQRPSASHPYEIEVTVLNKKSRQPIQGVPVYVQELVPGGLFQMGHYEDAAFDLTDPKGKTVVKSSRLDAVEINARPCKNFFANGFATVRRRAPTEGRVTVTVYIDPEYCTGKKKWKPQ